MTTTKTNTLGGERPRNEHDAYFTPDELAHEIAERVKGSFGSFDTIVEPSAGGGAFVRAANAVWPGARIEAVEPHFDLPGDLVNACALWSYATWEQYDESRWKGRVLILGNPPYNLPGDGRGDKPTTAERHVQLALDRLRSQVRREETHPDHVVAFLLRGSFLAGGGRIARLHRQWNLAHVWHLTPRPSFTDGGTDASEYALFTWATDHDGPYTGDWLRWRD